MRIPLAFAAALLVAGGAFAQDMTAAVYRLNFAIHEMDSGKRLNTRNYTMLLESGGKGVLKVGTKVPIATAPGPNTQYTYIDVGVNVDARIVEQGSQLRLNANIEVSNLGAERENQGRPMPQVRQLRSDVDAWIPAGKPTPVVTLDDPATSKHYEIEVTATKVK